MRVRTEYLFEVAFSAPNDAQLTVEALRAAAGEWARCSNESEPLLHLADQIAKQFPA